MKIEVGKTYRTRGGGKATVEKWFTGHTPFPFMGKVINGIIASNVTWTEEGTYLGGGGESSHDLVSEWPDETTDRAQLAALDASSAFNAQAHVQQKGQTLNSSDDAKAKTRIDVDYWPLKAILNEALEQASKGKGNERHANGRPFDRQPIMEHGRLTGPAGPSFQALKKIGEAQGMLARGEKDAAIRELLGAVVYCAASVILVRENSNV